MLHPCIQQVFGRISTPKIPNGLKGLGLVCQQEVACRMAYGNLISFLGRDKLNPQTTGGPNVFQETNPHWLLSFPPSHHLSWFLCRQKRLRWGVFLKKKHRFFWALGGSSHLVRETTLLRGTMVINHLQVLGWSSKYTVHPLSLTARPKKMMFGRWSGFRLGSPIFRDVCC